MTGPLYRVFPHIPGVAPMEAGGPLHVSRDRQGSGRHDNPDHYGALYVSAVPESAIGERIQGFRGQRLTDADLTRRDGSHLALVGFDTDALGPVVDLDDPAQLLDRGLRPSRVATRVRRITRRISLGIFDEGAVGLAWWSTLEASWANTTLFAERAIGALKVGEGPIRLTIDHPAVRRAGEALGIGIGP